MIMASAQTNWIIKPLVPEPIYTDRQEFLDFFHKAALNAARRLTLSTVMLGQRRMGKTEIFKRVVNRLFFEQDPESPDAVVPVYFSFPDRQMSETRFALKYLDNFIRYYIGFRTRQPAMIVDGLEGEELMSRVAASRDLYPFSRTFDLLFTWRESIEKKYSVFPDQTAVEVPRRVSDIDNSTIAVFLDEFQNTRLPQYDFDIVGFMQEAVESPTCPHFVTGSAMSILSSEIIGRGALFGRFRGMDIKPMTGYWGAELARKAAAYGGVEMPELMAPVVSDRCGGNPFYITAVVNQAALAGGSIPDEETINRLLAVDLSSGFIWGELHDQVTRWIERINEYGVTKWILYLSALDENTEEDQNGRLNVERIQREVSQREGREVSLETVRDVLVKLSRGDLLEYLELGRWFRRVKDPILLEFLKVWGRVEVEGQNAERVRNELEIRYDQMERRIREYKGYLAEVFMCQALWNAQRKTLPAEWFHGSGDVKMPDYFIFIRSRYRLGTGKGREIDVLAAAGPRQWVCQSRWRIGRPAGVGVLEGLLTQAQWIKEDMDPLEIRMWLFSHDGLTADAEKMAREKGILWSDRKDLDALLEHLGLRPLPDL